MNYPIKVFTAFSGYDSQCMALDKLNIEYELVGWSEIDKYAIQAHNTIYPQYTDNNYGDITNINWTTVPKFDLFTYSFPCQDISTAGLQKGMKEGSGTRSSLLWECKKAIEEHHPKYLLMENVKALTQKKFIPYLNQWKEYLNSQGYTNYTSVLNAKDYGIPQNRERVFMVSTLDNIQFEFPKQFSLAITLKNILEESVDEKYYLKKHIQDRFTYTNSSSNIIGTTKPDFRTIGQRDIVYNTNSYIGALTATDYKQPKQIAEEYIYRNTRVQKLVDSGKINPSNITFLDAYNQQTKEDICGTIRTTISSSCMHFITIPNGSNYRIRKLTPRECLRLMGVSEDNINKLTSSGISDTQLYKLSGNSIVVDVLYYIFKQLFKNKG